jgi:hypothetical protein
MKLSDSQKYLLPYVEKYQTLVKAIAESITNYRADCVIIYSISQKEIDWLIFRLYPALQLRLENFRPFDRAKDIQQTISAAHNVLVSLSNSVGFEKYLKGPCASQDLKLLMDANIAAGKILEAPLLPSTDAGGQEKKGTPNPPKIDESEWSNWGQLKIYMRVMGFSRSYRRFRTWTKTIKMQRNGPQQIRFCLDGLDKTTRKKLESVK